MESRQAAGTKSDVPSSGEGRKPFWNIFNEIVQLWNLKLNLIFISCFMLLNEKKKQEHQNVNPELTGVK